MIDFVFMLTRQDRTILDCLEVFEEIKTLGLGHVGFKDIGADMGTLRRLTAEIKSTGAVSYLEVVSTSDDACLRSARAAVELGVDRLLGGTNIEAVLEAIRGTKISYLPFAGRPHGHPTVLDGTPAGIESDCRRFAEYGCAGVDLLAYRAIEANPIHLVRAARAGMPDNHVLVAGSIDSPERIRDVAEAGADSFTIGTAALEGSFSPRKGALKSQLMDIMEACGDIRG